jgi:hypothetical protein
MQIWDHNNPGDLVKVRKCVDTSNSTITATFEFSSGLKSKLGLKRFYSTFDSSKNFVGIFFLQEMAKHC